MITYFNPSVVTNTYISYIGTGVFQPNQPMDPASKQYDFPFVTFDNAPITHLETEPGLAISACPSSSV
jgi:hypothetical protein